MTMAGSSLRFRLFRANVSQGETEEEALVNVKEAISLHMESLAADGQPIVKAVSIKESVVSVSL
jgi:predicted RNase H-like HicB family nuclease